MYPRIKICCIASVREAQDAIAHGADALGLVSHMPSGPGVIPVELITEIVASVPPPIATFLLTSRQDAESIAEQHAQCGASAIQLVDRVPLAELAKLRRKLPTTKIVQVIHILGDESIDEAHRVAPHVDALLLDSGNPQLDIKELGGTGRTHNWEISRQIRETVQKPVFLAGGLRQSNVASAIAAVKPFGLDLCSGVRENGRLSVEKLIEFMRAARNPA